ncbi:MAG: glycoside hydrolase family 13 protein, partial [Clostridia bacterium]|nr:glycoside hydrolase family 13 protein [Clostridia bacterium]
KTEYGWTVSLKINETGLYFYRFSLLSGGYIACNYYSVGEFTNEYGNDFLLTVYAKNYKTPAWFKGGVMYQIFPDRFCKFGSMPDITGRIARNWGEDPYYKPNELGKVLNNDFFGGNFKGVQSKLPYLKSLGVTTIYFNPVFEAASNHRYDTSDYMKIDPILGDKKDFEELVEAAKTLGIRVILDGVFNHTGDNSVYFNKYGQYPSLGAYQSKDSPYYSWYSFQRFPDRYSSWWGIDILPEINENSASYQEFIFGDDGVLKTWLKSGIGGYRLDVADELPDFFLKKLRKSVKDADKNAIIIGEVWEDASDKIAYSKRRQYLQGYELDSVMNYPLKNAIVAYAQTGNANELVHTVRFLMDHYPKQTVDCLMNILGTHDTPRILTVLGGKICYNKDEMAQKTAYLSETEKKNAVKKLKMAALLQYTLPGVPCVYYGDENGMEGHIDPFCRRCFDWDSLNEDLIAFYQKLGAIRKQFHWIFKNGSMKLVAVQNGLFVFKRSKANSNVYVYVNNDKNAYSVDFKKKYYNYIQERDCERIVNVQPYSYGILANRKHDGFKNLT